MTGKEYQCLAMTTLNPELTRKDVLVNAVMGLCGESGEAIDIVKKQLYISVTNSMMGKAGRIGGSFLSTKQGHQGFGLLSIDSIVAKYHGYLNRQTEEGVFATEVMLPLTEG